jgi:serine/threonine-protein kinase
MGEVYRATDSRLRREVAIKVLPASLSSDPDRIARLQREAEVLAQLNHPNIAAIHGLEEGDGIKALVMELAEGPTLANRIERGAVPIDEAVRIAKQIAAALGAAHERGIIHRDLKPANIKLRPDGTVKVLDFGLAKTLDGLLPAGPRGTTIARHAMTQTGVILGTAAYMSPEQARGQPVDKRTDVWSFGCVLFELLTGHASFDGETASDVIAHVLQSAPDWSALPPDAAALQGVLRHCLEKDVNRRLRDIGDAALLLDDAVTQPPELPRSETKSAKRNRWLAIAAAGIVAGAAVAVFDAARAPAEHEPLARFALATSRDATFVADQARRNVAIAPDGSMIAYTADRGGGNIGLVVQRLDDLHGRWLAGADGGTDPIFSPDGKEVVFNTYEALKRVPIAGGPSTTICPLDAYFTGATWGPHGVIVNADFTFGLFRVSTSGGPPEKLAVPDQAKQEYAFSSPLMLPDGQAVLYTVEMTDGSSRIVARRFGKDAETTLVDDGFDPRYLPFGYLVFARGDQLLAVRFDATTLQTKGDPVVVERGIFNKAAAYAANFDAATNGTAVYVVGHDAPSFSRVVWADRHGARQGALIGQPVELPRNPRISADGLRVVLTIGPLSNGQVWVYDVQGAAQPLKLTFRDHGAFPVWSPDRKRIAFWWRTSQFKGLFSVASDGGSSEPEPIKSDQDDVVPLDWSPDGEQLVYQEPPSHVPPKIGVLRFSEGKGRPWLTTPFSDEGGRLSPNGHWLAYATNQTGSFELWVRPFPGPGAPVRISSNGGRKPLWSQDGKEIFFENGPRLLSARVLAEEPDFRTAPPQILFEGGFKRDDLDPDIRYMDVAPDGRFLMVEAAEQPDSASMIVAPHWDRELKRLLAGR